MIDTSQCITDRECAEDMYHCKNFTARFFTRVEYGFKVYELKSQVVINNSYIVIGANVLQPIKTEQEYCVVYINGVEVKRFDVYPHEFYDDVILNLLREYAT